MIGIARRLTLPLAALVTIASTSGLLFPWVYGEETPSWAAQGQGQDAVNLLVVVPVLLYALAQINRGSFGAWLVWLGVTIYSTYSYLLYALFVHFTAAFPVYVATLGLSFYALFGGALSVPWEWLAQIAARLAPQRATALFLRTMAILFTLLWGADIAAALASGRPPESALALGFVVNPVHVLDLAFALPGLFITGALLARRHPLGYLFAVPMLVFSALMGLAIVGMMAAMSLRGIPSSAAVGGAMVASASISVFLATRLLAEVAHVDYVLPAFDRPAPAAQEGA